MWLEIIGVIHIMMLNRESNRPRPGKQRGRDAAFGPAEAPTGHWILSDPGGPGYARRP